MSPEELQRAAVATGHGVRAQCEGGHNSTAQFSQALKNAKAFFAWGIFQEDETSEHNRSRIFSEKSIPFARLGSSARTETRSRRLATATLLTFAQATAGLSALAQLPPTRL